MEINIKTKKTVVHYIEVDNKELPIEDIMDLMSKLEKSWETKQLYTSRDLIKAYPSIKWLAENGGIIFKKTQDGKISFSDSEILKNFNFDNIKNGLETLKSGYRHSLSKSE